MQDMIPVETVPREWEASLQEQTMKERTALEKTLLCTCTQSIRKANLGSFGEREIKKKSHGINDLSIKQ